jgi:hypothetical protein
MDTSEFAFPKPSKSKPKPEGLKRGKPLKSKVKPINKKVVEAVFQEKGRFCLMGLCEHCGGTAPATDPHHYPHKARGGQDIVAHLWPINRICHGYYHDHPIEEKEQFKWIEEMGFKVIWKVDVK